MRRLLLLVLVSGCAFKPQPPAMDPEARFAAYRERNGFALDRLPGGGSGEVRPGSWLRLGGEPTFVFETAEARSGIWMESPSRVVARIGTARDAALIGEATAAWEDNAIRVTLAPANGKPWQAGTFTREGAGSPEVLRRDVQLSLDLRGTYRAPIHPPDGGPSAWLRVRISPYADTPRRYEAAGTAALPAEVLAAAVMLVDAEIDWIEDHAVNAYRGDGGGTLHQSVPISR